MRSTMRRIKRLRPATSVTYLLAWSALPLTTPACLTVNVFETASRSFREREVPAALNAVRQDPATGDLYISRSSHTVYDESEEDDTPLVAQKHDRYAILNSGAFAARQPSLALATDTDAAQGPLHTQGVALRTAPISGAPLILPEQGLRIDLPRWLTPSLFAILRDSLPENQGAITRVVAAETPATGRDLFFYFDRGSIGRYTQLYAKFGSRHSEFGLLKLYTNETQLRKRIPDFPAKAKVLKAQPIDVSGQLLIVRFGDSRRMYRLARPPGDPGWGTRADAGRLN